MCAALAVSRSGYYNARRPPEGVRRRQDDRLRVEIGRIHQESRGSSGSPRIHTSLDGCGLGGVFPRHRMLRRWSWEWLGGGEPIRLPGRDHHQRPERSVGRLVHELVRIRILSRQAARVAKGSLIRADR